MAPSHAGRALTTLPGPRGLPLLGHVLQLRPTQLHAILERWADRYGPLYTFRLMRQPVVVIAEPSLIQEVLRQRPETYRRLRTMAAVCADLGGEGVFVAEGARWRRQRRVVMQALSPLQLRQFFPTLLAVTARLQTRWDQAARAGNLVDIPAELRRYTAEVTTALTFGEAMGTVEGAWEGLHEHLAQILPTINRRGNALLPSWHLVSLPADRACAQALAALETVMVACIAQGRAQLAQDPSRATHLTTVLEGLLAARDEAGAALSDREILSNLLTMLVAGEDTTAHTMAWMLHFMTEVPGVQSLMQHEVDAVLGDALMLPDVQTQERLGSVDAVAQETMRLKSVAPLLCFEPLHPVELGGLHLPAGTGVFLLTRYVGLQEPALRVQPDSFSRNAGCSRRRGGSSPPGTGTVWGRATGVSRTRPGVPRNQSGDEHALPPFYGNETGQGPAGPGAFCFDDDANPAQAPAARAGVRALSPTAADTPTAPAWCAGGKPTRCDGGGPGWC